MSNLIKSNLFTMIKGKTFYVCLIVSILFAMAMPLFYQVLQKQMLTMSQTDKSMVHNIVQMQPEGMQGLSMGFTTTILEKKENANLTWMVGQILASGFIGFILVIFVSNLITREFSFGTIRNSVAKGFSRNKIYLAKFVTVILASLVIVLATILAGGLVAGLVYGFEIEGSTFFSMIGIEVLLYMALVSIFTMVGMTLRKKFSVMITNISIQTIGSSLLSIVNLLIGSHIVLTQYWIPSNILEMGEVTVEQGAIMRCAICAIVYIVVSILIGTRVFKKRDMK